MSTPSGPPTIDQAIAQYTDLKGAQKARQDALNANNKIWKGMQGNPQAVLMVWIIRVLDADSINLTKTPFNQGTYKGKDVGSTLLDVEQGKISVFSGQMNCMTAYRNTNANAQNLFNQAQKGPVDESKIRAALDEMSNGTKLTAAGFDDISKKQIQDSAASLKGIMDKWSSKGGLNGLWKAAQDINDKDGAADDLKTMTNGFNNLNSSVSIMSKTVDVKLNNTNADIKQFSAIVKSLMDMWKQQISTFIQKSAAQ